MRESITGQITFEFDTGTDPDGKPEFVKLEDIFVQIGTKHLIEFSLAQLQGAIQWQVSNEDLMALLAEEKEEMRKGAEESAAEVRGDDRGGFW